MLVQTSPPDAEHMHAMRMAESSSLNGRRGGPTSPSSYMVHLLAHRTTFRSGPQ